MKELNGPISERLRRLFGKDVKRWPAYRASESKSMPADTYTGVDLSVPGKRGQTGRHRRTWR